MSSIGSEFNRRRGETARDWQARLRRIRAAAIPPRRREEWNRRLVLAARAVKREALEQGKATAGHVIAPAEAAAFVEYRLVDVVRVGP